MNPSSHVATEPSFAWAVARKAPHLDQEQERSLARRVRQNGDREAAELLARAHLRTVVTLASKYRHYGVPVPELIAEGNCGLAIALGKFDPERGVRFVTYAAFWIKAQILAYIIRSRSIVAGHGSMRSQVFFKFRRERARATVLYGEGELAAAELATRMGMTPENVAATIRRLDYQDISLDAPFSDDAGSTWLDKLQADADENPEGLLAESRSKPEIEAKVERALRVLDPRERYVVETRLMAEREEELSLAEIGRVLGVSRERARQLEARAKKKLRQAVESAAA
ncbi:MAG TPA: sigma-70 family RNA polymerase sigma factor [Polyangiaceae bacterium]|nr:sigma-70 family RNA polymerase sigma factor [Polyangiaceae bacterium]